MREIARQVCLDGIVMIRVQANRLASVALLSIIRKNWVAPLPQVLFVVILKQMH